ncbi:MAG: four helix bundle protein [Bacteroidales bacterium]
MTIEKFEDLEVWKESRMLCIRIFQITSSGGFNQDLRFKFQIRNASGSIMDNIAEGFGRGGNKEFINFLSIAKGSNEEVRSQLYRASDFGYISEEQCNEILEMAEILSRRISALMQYLKSSSMKGSKFKA